MMYSLLESQQKCDLYVAVFICSERSVHLRRLPPSPWDAFMQQESLYPLIFHAAGAAAPPLLLLEQRIGAQLLAHGHDLGPVLQREVDVLLALDVVRGDEHGPRDGGGGDLRGLRR